MDIQRGAIGVVTFVLPTGQCPTAPSIGICLHMCQCCCRRWVTSEFSSGRGPTAAVGVKRHARALAALGRSSWHSSVGPGVVYRLFWGLRRVPQSCRKWPPWYLPTSGCTCGCPRIPTTAFSPSPTGEYEGNSPRRCTTLIILSSQGQLFDLAHWTIYLGILQWARFNGCTWNEEKRIGAAEGDLSLFSWACLNGHVSGMKARVPVQQEQCCRRGA